MEKIRIKNVGDWPVDPIKPLRDVYDCLEQVHPDIKESSIIAGGAISSLIRQERVNDYDVFFKDKVVEKVISDFVENVGEPDEKLTLADRASKRDYLVIAAEPSSKLEGPIFGEGAKYKLVQVNLNDSPRKWKPNLEVIGFGPNAITIRCESGQVVQLITRNIHPKPKEIIYQFDFLHTYGYYNPVKEQIVTYRETVKSNLKKKLQYTGSSFPVSSLIRLKKYLNRGWKIGAKDLFHLAADMSKINLNDPEVLLSQVTSIDAALFLNLLAKRGVTPEAILANTELE